MAFTRFEKENRLFSKFGIENLDLKNFYISKSHFDYETDGYIPKQYDIVQDVFKFYEVIEVKENEGIFLMSQQYTWKLICKKLKDDFSISLSGDALGSPLSACINTKDDRFDIRNDVDISNENIKYTKKPTEKNSGGYNEFW
jgi:hypothetical protein